MATYPRSHTLARGLVPAGTPNQDIHINTSGGAELVKEWRFRNQSPVNQTVTIVVSGGATGSCTVIQETVAGSAVLRQNQCYLVLEDGAKINLAHSGAVGGVEYDVEGLRFN